jgi:hypothetical protein
MFGPVRDFFAGLGYAVNAEVLGMDMCLQKDGVLTVIELKLGLNLKLLTQAVDRQSVTSQVFVAVPRPRYPKGKEGELKRRIVKRLDLGLIYVDMDRGGVEIVHFPPAVAKTPSPKRREKVAKEISGRSVDINIGGRTGKPVATAYREKALRAAVLLEGGAKTAKELRDDYGMDASVYYILRNNHYGWFEKVSAGRYGLSAGGVAMLADGEFGEVVDLFKGLERNHPGASRHPS